MCYGQQRPFDENLTPSRTVRSPADAAAVATLRGRLAETEARLTLARAREGELIRQLDEMKRFGVVMEIVEEFLSRRYIQQRDLALALLLRPRNHLSLAAD